MIQTLSRRVLSTTALAALAVAAFAGPVAAQGFTPDREIRLVCGYAAGTGADIIVRYFAEKLRPMAGKPIIVENKPGALTQVAAEQVARAKPDGYTLFITAGNSTMSSNPHLHKKINYDPLKDFTPVTTLAKLPFLVVVSSNGPLNSMADLKKHLESKGEKGTYAYPNTFSLAATELYKQIAGLKTQGAAYRATPEALNDLLRGDIDLLIGDASFLLVQSQQGRGRPLAVTTAERSSIAPNIPGMKEAGVPGFDLSAWWAAWLPPAVPAPIVKTYADWLNQIVALPETKEFLNKNGAEPWLSNTESLTKHMTEDLKRWGEIIKLAKIEPQ